MRFVILGGGPAGYAAAAAASASARDVTARRGRRPRRQLHALRRDPVEDAAAHGGVMATVDRAERSASASSTAARRRPAAHDRARPLRCRAPVAIDPRPPRGHRRRASSTAAAASPRPARVLGHDRASASASSPTTALLLATGAAPWEPPFAQVDHARVFTPRDVLDPARAPEHLLVVGAGATGCEYAEFFLSLRRPRDAALGPRPGPAGRGPRHRRDRRGGVPGCAAWSSSSARA